MLDAGAPRRRPDVGRAAGCPAVWPRDGQGRFSHIRPGHAPRIVSMPATPLTDDVRLSPADDVPAEEARLTWYARPAGTAALLLAAAAGRLR